MKKILRQVLDIDPADPTVIELDRLAKKFDLKSMIEVVLQIRQLYEMQNQKVAMTLNLSTYRAVARTFLGAAIVNYAVSVHPEFFLDIQGEDGESPRIFQTNDPNTHREYADNYFDQVKKIISQFEN